MPETVVLLTAILALMFGAVEIGELGFLQVMSDGAAFIGAHEYALNTNSDYQTLAGRPFPNLVTPMDIDQRGPLPITLPVTYDESNAAGREGGVTLIRPNTSQATAHMVSTTGFIDLGVGSLGDLDVHGAAIEPSVLMSNRMYDVEGLGYAGTGNPKPFFNSPMDTPVYYDSVHRLVRCTGSFGASCPAGQLELRSLGTAEFLDQNNWSRTVQFGDPNVTFAEMACHQNAFAAAASGTFKSGIMPTAAQVSLTQNPTLAKIYGWDAVLPYNSPGSGSATFGTTKLAPMNGC